MGCLSPRAGRGLCSRSGNAARRQPTVRGSVRRSLIRKHLLTLALRACCADDEVAAALSPPAGRGGGPCPT
ncbi:hypothetical protein DK419_10420 [Methylobacterium terrae]|uniref:Uncharacterized protein n=1 Tax=Methylobacterium terrae TaxID=2202827 RepID=A0A2U8WKA8_9HYPH|nr:hypothetical protein DK419_10420 [Methylobacterium terrae]